MASGLGLVRTSSEPVPLKNRTSPDGLVYYPEPGLNQTMNRRFEPVPYRTVDITELRAEFYCPENCRHGLGIFVPGQDGLLGSPVLSYSS